MPKLVWDQTGDRMFETGVEKGVFYARDASGAYPLGVAWNGLVGVTESPSGAEATPFYADNIKYLELRSAEEFGATVEAYTYPDEFALVDGSAAPAVGVKIGQQSRGVFGLCYKTQIGNDVDGQDHGYNLHLIYGATASPSEKSYQTINESPEAITFSWELTTQAIAISGFKPSATLIIDSTKVDPTKLAALEALLYGDEVEPASLPLPDAVITLISAV